MSDWYAKAEATWSKLGREGAHIALVRRMRFDWWSAETGAVSVDPKRPYGNSDVPYDVARILGEQLPDEDVGDDVGAWFDGNYDRLLGLHFGACVALEILAHTLDLRPGLYVRPKFCGFWERAAA